MKKLTKIQQTRLTDLKTLVKSRIEFKADSIPRQLQNQEDDVLIKLLADLNDTELFLNSNNWHVGLNIKKEDFEENTLYAIQQAQGMRKSIQNILKDRTGTPYLQSQDCFIKEWQWQKLTVLSTPELLIRKEQAELNIKNKKDVQMYKITLRIIQGILIRR